MKIANESQQIGIQIEWKLRLKRESVYWNINDSIGILFVLVFKIYLISDIMLKHFPTYCLSVFCKCQYNFNIWFSLALSWLGCINSTWHLNIFPISV